MKTHHYLVIFILFFISCKGDHKPNKATLENEKTTYEKKVFLNKDFNELLTLEIAVKITGFDSSNVQKTSRRKGMTSEILKYHWEHQNEVSNEVETTSSNKRIVRPRVDFVQINFVVFDTDKASFLNFVSVSTHPELSEIPTVGEISYWNSTKKYLEVYSNGVSFRVMAVVSDDDDLNKEKTIQLAQLIIKEKLN